MKNKKIDDLHKIHFLSNSELYSKWCTSIIPTSMNINPGIIDFIQRLTAYHKGDIIILPGRKDT